MSESNYQTGSCLCGAVRLKAAIASDSVDACHCSMCRQWGGGPFMALECDGEVQIEGEEHVSTFASSEWAERGFCKQCGTHLFYRLREQHHYAFPVGLFGDAQQWRFKSQIFVDEKPSWYAFANDTKNLTGEEVFALFSQS